MAGSGGSWGRPIAAVRDGVLDVHVPLEPPSLNGKDGLLRSHWRKRREVKARIEEHLQLALAQTSAPPAPARARVRYFRSYYRRPLDPDNLTASAKLVLDVLQAQGVLRSDAPEHLELEVDQGLRGDRGPFFQLRIQPCTD